jgi:hypothetical protein
MWQQTMDVEGLTWQQKMNVEGLTWQQKLDLAVNHLEEFEDEESGTTDRGDFVSHDDDDEVMPIEQGDDDDDEWNQRDSGELAAMDATTMLDYVTRERQALVTQLEQQNLAIVDSWNEDALPPPPPPPLSSPLLPRTQRTFDSPRALTWQQTMLAQGSVPVAKTGVAATWETSAFAGMKDGAGNDIHLSEPFKAKAPTRKERKQLEKEWKEAKKAGAVALAIQLEAELEKAKMAMRREKELKAAKLGRNRLVEKPAAGTELVLTVLIFFTELVPTVLIYRTELVPTVLVFRTELVLTVLIFLTALICLAELVPTVLVFLTRYGR